MKTNFSTYCNSNKIMNKDIFNKRSFINKTGFHSNAALITNIERAEYSDGGFYSSYKLSDCNRTVEISIDLYNLKEYENTIYKLNKIIEITSSFKEAIINLKPEIVEIVKKRKLKEKQRAIEKAKSDKENKV